MKLFADRGFVSINGVEVTHLTSANISRSNNATPKETMTRNRRNAGFSLGNISINLDLELAIEKKLAQIDTALANDDADIKVVFECGGERYTVIDCVEAEMSISSSVGDASKSLKLIGLDIVNENGDSVNASISL